MRRGKTRTLERYELVGAVAVWNIPLLANAGRERGILQSGRYRVIDDKADNDVGAWRCSSSAVRVFDANSDGLFKASTRLGHIGHAALCRAGLACHCLVGYISWT